MDKAREWTDRELAKMERKIERIYKQAEKEVSKKYKAYMKESDKRIRPLETAYKKALKVGDSDKVQEAKNRLKQAKLNNTLYSSHYKDILNLTAREMANTNKTALAYINDQMPSIYRINYNNIAYEFSSLKNDNKLGFRFDIVDEATVKRRIKEGKIISHKKQLDYAKDVAWNQKFINGQVLQGIIQGDSMRDISKRIFPEIISKAERKPNESEKDFIKRNQQSAIRNARTMVTQAENSGRLDSYKYLVDNGIIMRKVWMATPDDRTRPTHIDLDGEEQDVDKEFSNKCMFPADPDGPAEEVWQCRCTMTTNIIGYRGKNGKVSYFDKSLRSPTMHETQMAEEKERRIAESNDEKTILTKEEGFAEKIKVIQERTEQNGFIHEDDIYEAGKIMQAEMMDTYADSIAKIEEAKKEFERLSEESSKAHAEYSMWRRKGTYDQQLFNDAEWRKKRDELRDAWEQKQKKTDYAEKALRSVELKGDKSTLMLKEKLSEVRSMGSGGFDIKEHLRNSRSPVRKNVEYAYDKYPTSWVKASVDKGQMSVKKTGRGYYSEWRKEIAISGRTEDKLNGTAMHELAHRFERAVPEIRKQEKLFYEKRTAGEELKWLGYPYPRDEVTRIDKFINAYMGKDYEGTAYELASMGFEYAYTDPLLLAKDADMQQWILGMLVVIP